MLASDWYDLQNSYDLVRICGRTDRSCSCIWHIRCAFNVIFCLSGWCFQAANKSFSRPPTVCYLENVVNESVVGWAVYTPFLSWLTQQDTVSVDLWYFIRGTFAGQNASLSDRMYTFQVNTRTVMTKCFLTLNQAVMVACSGVVNHPRSEVWHLIKFLIVWVFTAVTFMNACSYFEGESNL